MKKYYSTPKSKVLHVIPILLQETSTTGSDVHPDDPQDPGGALSDENSDFWDDYE